MKAALLKSYKASNQPINNNSSLSEDDVPLGQLTPIKKVDVASNGHLNGVNGHSAKDSDAMDEEDKPLVSCASISKQLT